MRYNILYIKEVHATAWGYPCHVTELRPVNSAMPFSEEERKGKRLVLRKANLAERNNANLSDLDEVAVEDSLIEFLNKDTEVPLAGDDKVRFRSKPCVLPAKAKAKGMNLGASTGMVVVEEKDMPFAIIENVEVDDAAKALIERRRKSLNPDNLPAKDSILANANLLDVPEQFWAKEIPR